MLKLIFSLVFLVFACTKAWSYDQVTAEKMLVLIQSESNIGPDLEHQIFVGNFGTYASVQNRKIYIEQSFAQKISIDALAFVIAHEVAHTSLQHSTKMAWAAIFKHGLFKFILGKTEGLINSIHTHPELLAVSRSQELEADEKAAQILRNLGVNPCAAFEEVIRAADGGVISDELVPSHGSNYARLQAVCSLG